MRTLPGAVKSFLIPPSIDRAEAAVTPPNDLHSASDHAAVPVVGPMRRRAKRKAAKHMAYNKQDIARVLAAIDFGSTVAEQDTLLETARVETSVFSDLLHDKIDLIPGTKGSGKSALYRIFVDFLAETLLSHRKVVVAHGVQQFGDNVFLIYKEHFDKLSEDDFVSFWCIYLVSLAHEQFVKQPRFAPFLTGCANEVANFKAACQRSSIPDIKTQQTLSGIIGWVLSVLKVWRPKISYQPPYPDAGTYTVDNKFVGGKTDYSEERLKSLLGNDWKAISEDLVSIGLLARTTSGGRGTFKVPFLYRDGLELTQGKAL